MKIAVLKERRFNETRTAATPESVKKLIGLKHTIAIEAGAGATGGIRDEDYVAAGATVGSAADVLKGADIIFKVRAPDAAFAYTYGGAAGLKTLAPTSAGCQTSWNSVCRIVINYTQHIHPLWYVDRTVRDPNDNTIILADHTCTACHTPVDPANNAPRVPAGQLDLAEPFAREAIAGGRTRVVARWRHDGRRPHTPPPSRRARRATAPRGAPRRPLSPGGGDLSGHARRRDRSEHRSLLLPGQR